MASTLNDQLTLTQHGVFPQQLDLIDDTDPVWARVNDELVSRKRSRQMPDNWASLSRALGVSIQVTTNWARRGIPPRSHMALAHALGWSVDRLLGIEQAPEPAPVRAHPSDDLAQHEAAYCAVLAILSRHIVTADAGTREVLAPLLRRMAADPRNAVQSSRMIEALLWASTADQARLPSGRRVLEMGPPPGIQERRAVH